MFKKSNRPTKSLDFPTQIPNFTASAQEKSDETFEQEGFEESEKERKEKEKQKRENEEREKEKKEKEEREKEKKEKKEKEEKEEKEKKEKEKKTPKQKEDDQLLQSLFAEEEKEEHKEVPPKKMHIEKPKLNIPIINSKTKPIQISSSTSSKKTSLVIPTTNKKPASKELSLIDSLLASNENKTKSWSNGNSNKNSNFNYVRYDAFKVEKFKEEHDRSKLILNLNSDNAIDGFSNRKTNGNNNNNNNTQNSKSTNLPHVYKTELSNQKLTLSENFENVEIEKIISDINVGIIFVGSYGVTGVSALNRPRATFTYDNPEFDLSDKNSYYFTLSFKASVTNNQYTQKYGNKQFAILEKTVSKNLKPITISILARMLGELYEQDPEVVKKNMLNAIRESISKKIADFEYYFVRPNLINFRGTEMDVNEESVFKMYALNENKFWWAAIVYSGYADSAGVERVIRKYYKNENKIAMHSNKKALIEQIINEPRKLFTSQCPQGYPMLNWKEIPTVYFMLDRQISNLESEALKFYQMFLNECSKKKASCLTLFEVQQMKAGDENALNYLCAHQILKEIKLGSIEYIQDAKIYDAEESVLKKLKGMSNLSETTLFPHNAIKELMFADKTKLKLSLEQRIGLKPLTSYFGVFSGFAGTGKTETLILNAIYAMIFDKDPTSTALIASSSSVAAMSIENRIKKVDPYIPVSITHMFTDEIEKYIKWEQKRIKQLKKEIENAKLKQKEKKKDNDDNTELSDSESESDFEEKEREEEGEEEEKLSDNELMEFETKKNKKDGHKKGENKSDNESGNEDENEDIDDSSEDSEDEFKLLINEFREKEHSKNGKDAKEDLITQLEINNKNVTHENRKSIVKFETWLEEAHNLYRLKNENKLNIEELANSFLPKSSDFKFVSSPEVKDLLSKKDNKFQSRLVLSDISDGKEGKEEDEEDEEEDFGIGSKRKKSFVEDFNKKMKFEYKLEPIDPKVLKCWIKAILYKTPLNHIKWMEEIVKDSLTITGNRKIIDELNSENQTQTGSSKKRKVFEKSDSIIIEDDEGNENEQEKEKEKENEKKKETEDNFDDVNEEFFDLDDFNTIENIENFEDISAKDEDSTFNLDQYLKVVKQVMDGFETRSELFSLSNLKIKTEQVKVLSSIKDYENQRYSRDGFKQVYVKAQFERNEFFCEASKEMMTAKQHQYNFKPHPNYLKLVALQEKRIALEKNKSIKGNKEIKNVFDYMKLNSTSKRVHFHHSWFSREEFIHFIKHRIFVSNAQKIIYAHQCKVSKKSYQGMTPSDLENFFDSVGRLYNDEFLLGIIQMAELLETCPNPKSFWLFGDHNQKTSIEIGNPAKPLIDVLNSRVCYLNEKEEAELGFEELALSKHRVLLKTNHRVDHGSGDLKDALTKIMEGVMPNASNHFRKFFFDGSDDKAFEEKLFEIYTHTDWSAHFGGAGGENGEEEEEDDFEGEEEEEEEEEGEGEEIGEYDGEDDETNENRKRKCKSEKGKGKKKAKKQKKDKMEKIYKKMANESQRIIVTPFLEMANYCNRILFSRFFPDIYVSEVLPHEEALKQKQRQKKLAINEVENMERNYFNAESEEGGEIVGGNGNEEEEEGNSEKIKNLGFINKQQPQKQKQLNFGNNNNSNRNSNNKNESNMTTILPLVPGMLIRVKKNTMSMGSSYPNGYIFRISKIYAVEPPKYGKGSYKKDSTKFINNEVANHVAELRSFMPTTANNSKNIYVKTTRNEVLALRDFGPWDLQPGWVSSTTSFQGNQANEVIAIFPGVTSNCLEHELTYRTFCSRQDIYSTASRAANRVVVFFNKQTIEDYLKNQTKTQPSIFAEKFAIHAIESGTLIKMPQFLKDIQEHLDEC